jgi:hypothetical protein
VKVISDLGEILSDFSHTYYSDSWIVTLPLVSGSTAKVCKD